MSDGGGACGNAGVENGRDERDTKGTNKKRNGNGPRQKGRTEGGSMKNQAEDGKGDD